MSHAPGPRPSDWASVDSLITALYDCVSGPAGERDWDRLRAMCLPGCRHIPTGRRPHDEGQAHGLRVYDVEGYIESARPLLAQHGFFETEIHRVTEQWGHLVHAWSTYESRHRPDDAEPFVRGINSIQLLYRENRWWVVTVFWDNESPDNPIPATYLK